MIDEKAQLKARLELMERTYDENVKDNEQLVRDFDACIRRVYRALDLGVAMGGVDTGHCLDRTTGAPYGPGGHTAHVLEQAALRMRRRLTRTRRHLVIACALGAAFAALFALTGCGNEGTPAELFDADTPASHVPLNETVRRSAEGGALDDHK